MRRFVCLSFFNFIPRRYSFFLFYFVQGVITELGRHMSQFPLEPNLSKLILKGIEYHCLQEVLTICAMVCSCLKKKFALFVFGRSSILLFSLGV
jgi:hypothetical protein